MKRYYVLSLLAGFVGLFTSLQAQWNNGFLPYFRSGNAVTLLSPDKAVVVGGNPANDSLQSVFTSDDKGASWNIRVDIFGEWLHSVRFCSPMVGVAVGNQGTILRTTDGGATWAAVTAPGNTANRHFNSVYFATNTVGYIAGGWPSDDSIQTILKTTDGGATWSIQRDGLGYWLKSIHFSDADNGIAVGDHGTVLKTTDGGATWSVVPLTGNIGARNYNAVYAIDNNTAIAVGGNKSNDSIQTIIKTTDGGTNWNIIKDNPDPMLNGIDFYNANTGYAVGDRGAFLKTTDGGDSWTDLGLPASVNDTFDLRSVDFYNADFGMAVGQLGKYLVYSSLSPTVPDVALLPVTDLAQDAATLNASVNARGTFAAVDFEYGTTQLLGTTIAATPDTVFGNTGQQVSVALNGLLPNTVYYYRVSARNTSGVASSSESQFFTGGCGIPNCSFESWDSTIVAYPSGVGYMGMPRQVASYDGSKAVELTTTPSRRGSAIFWGNVGADFPFLGGIPINAQPDSLVFYAKYNVVPGDSALVLAEFKKNGQETYLALFTFTGNSSGNFERLSFPFNFPDATVPDSVVIGITNSWPFREDDCPNSMLTIDKVQLIGAATPFPNADFEQWSADTSYFPLQWATLYQTNGSKFVHQVARTSDAVSGHYALKMTGIPDSEQALVYVGSKKTDSYNPAFPVAKRYDYFTFYAKYLQDNPLDTLWVSVYFYQAGQYAGFARWFSDTSITSYTPYSVLFDGAQVIPDSASLVVSIGSHSTGVLGHSVLYLDNLSFDGFGPTAVPVVQVMNSFYVYPNPAQNEVAVEWGLGGSEPIEITLCSLSGQVVKSWSGSADRQRTNFSLGDLASGFYLLHIKTQNQTTIRKLVINK